MKKLISIILITTFSFSLFPSMSNFVAASTETREKVDEVYGGPRKSKKSKVGKALAGIAGVAGGAAFAAKKLSSVANNGSLLKNSTNGLNGTGITPNPANVTTSYPVDVEKGNDQANVDPNNETGGILKIQGTDSAENNSFCDDGKVNYETTGMDTCYNSKYLNVTAYTELVENGNDQANASKNNEIVNDSVVNGTDSAVSNSANVTTSYSVDVKKGNGQANVDPNNETGSNITNQEETDGSSQGTPDAINASDDTGEKVDFNNPEKVRNSTDTEFKSDENDPKTEEQPDDLKKNEIKQDITYLASIVDSMKNKDNKLDSLENLNSAASINSLNLALTSLSATDENNQGSSGSFFSAGSLTHLKLPTPSEEKPNDDSQKLKNLPKLNDLISKERSTFTNPTIDKCCDDRSSVCLEDCESASGENITSFGSNQEDPAEDEGQDDEEDPDSENPSKNQFTQPNEDEWLNYVKWPGIGLAATYTVSALVCIGEKVNKEPWKCIFNPIRWLFNDESQNKGVGTFEMGYEDVRYDEALENSFINNEQPCRFIQFLKSLIRFFRQDENNQDKGDLL